MLNIVHIPIGKAVFIPPGELHSYLEGDLIECMANSDNVIRAGLTQKFQDAKVLLQMLQFESHLPVLREGEVVPGFGITRRFCSGSNEFCLDCCEVNSGKFHFEPKGSVELLFCLQGGCSLANSAGSLTLKTGRAALISATCTQYSVEVAHTSTFFRITVPV